MEKLLYFFIISSIIVKNFAGNNDDGPSQRRREKRPFETENYENLPNVGQREEDTAQENPQDFLPDFDALNITPEELDSWLNSAVHFNLDGENDGESREDSENIPDFEELDITAEEIESWLNPEVNFNVGERNEEAQSSGQQQNDVFVHPFPATIQTNLEHQNQQPIMIGHYQSMAKQLAENPLVETAAAAAARHLEIGKSTKFEAMDYADLEIFTEVYDLWLKAIYGENYLDSDGQQNPPEFDLDELNPTILESSSNIEEAEPPAKKPKHAAKTTKKKSKVQQAMAKNPDSQNPINVREQRKKEAAQRKQQKKEDAQRRKNGNRLKRFLRRQRMILQEMMTSKKSKRDNEESKQKAAAEGQSMQSNMNLTIEAEMPPSTASNLRQKSQILAVEEPSAASNLRLRNSTLTKSPSIGTEITDGFSHSAEALHHHYRQIRPRPILQGQKKAVPYISVPSRALLQKEKAKMRQEAIHRRPILPRSIPQGHETTVPYYIPVSSIFQKEKAKLNQGLKIRHYLLAMIDQALAKLRNENQELENELKSIYTKSWEFEMNANEKMIQKLQGQKSAIMDRRVALNKNVEIMNAERCKVMDQISEKNAKIARLNVK